MPVHSHDLFSISQSSHILTLRCLIELLKSCRFGMLAVDIALMSIAFIEYPGIKLDTGTPVAMK